ncbi:MAG: hypothetical protein QNK25_01050 [Desulfobacterales bacterium]|nr:hypothetical protein [Desulfobacterales bacterium]
MVRAFFSFFAIVFAAGVVFSGLDLAVSVLLVLGLAVFLTALRLVLGAAIFFTARFLFFNDSTDFFFGFAGEVFLAAVFLVLTTSVFGFLTGSLATCFFAGFFLAVAFGVVFLGVFSLGSAFFTIEYSLLPSILLSKLM